jgi:L-amino acid N-acyltransferase YncA
MSTPRDSQAGTIRLATPADTDQVLGIYAPVVRETVISFEYEPPTVEEMRGRMAKVAAHELPWLVFDRAGAVLGYVYASRHHERAAYQWSVDVAVYIHADARGAGLGRGLYTSLFTILALQGYYNLYAGITLPNPASVALHESMGFDPVGVYRRVGFKMGAWHDVGWWGRSLGEKPMQPLPALSLAAVQAKPGWSAALALGQPLIAL